MSDADPTDGDNPYEVLGASEQDTEETIEKQKDKVYMEYREQYKKAKNKEYASREENRERYTEAQKALRNIDDAWQWIQDNHEPPFADQPLSIDVLTDDPVVDAEVVVAVEGDNGPIENTPVEVSRDGNQIDTVRTKSDGRATYTSDRHGEVQFTAPTTDDYADAVAVVSIARKSADLDFRDLPSKPEVNESVTFGIEADGSPVADVSLEADGTDLGTTNNSGKLTWTFQDAGSRTVKASKPDDEAATYVSCEDEIEVEPETVEMEIFVEGSEYVIYDDVIIHVNESESGRPVKRADVSAGSATGETDDTGEVGLTLEDAGTVTVEATKTAPSEDRGYRKAETEIEVEKKQRGLRIKDVEGKRMEQAELTVHVIDGTGKDLEDARVETNWGHDARTDNSGEAKLPLNDSGSLRIGVTKPSDEIEYGSDSRTLEIDDFTRELEIASAPSTADPGDTVKIKVTDGAGNGVPDATVTSSKEVGEKWQTGEDGKVKISLSNQLGDRRIRVKKDGGDFNGAEVDETIRVL